MRHDLFPQEKAKYIIGLEAYIIRRELKMAKDTNVDETGLELVCRVTILPILLSLFFFDI